MWEFLAGKRLTDSEREDKDLAKISRGNIKPPPSRKHREKRAPRKGARRKRVNLVDPHLMGTDPHLSRDHRISASLINIDWPNSINSDDVLKQRLQQWINGINADLGRVRSDYIKNETIKYFRDLEEKVKNVRTASTLRRANSEGSYEKLLDDFNISNFLNSWPPEERELNRSIRLILRLSEKLVKALESSTQDGEYVILEIDGNKYRLAETDLGTFIDICDEINNKPQYADAKNKAERFLLASESLETLKALHQSNPGAFEKIVKLIIADSDARNYTDYSLPEVAQITIGGTTFYYYLQTLNQLKRLLGDGPQSSSSPTTKFDALSAAGFKSKAECENALGTLKGMLKNESPYVYLRDDDTKQRHMAVFKAVKSTSHKLNISKAQASTSIKQDSLKVLITKFEGLVKQLPEDWMGSGANADSLKADALKYFELKEFKAPSARPGGKTRNPEADVELQKKDIIKDGIEVFVKGRDASAKSMSNIYGLYDAKEVYENMDRVYKSMPDLPIYHILGMVLGCQDLLRKLKRYDAILPFLFQSASPKEARKLISERLIERRTTSRSYDDGLDVSGMKVFAVVMMVYTGLRKDGKWHEDEFKGFFDDVTDIAKDLSTITDVDNMVKDALKTFRRDKSVDIDDILRTKKDIGDSLNALSNIQRNFAIADAGMSWGDIFDMMIDHYERFLPTDTQKVNLNSFLKSYLEGKKRAASTSPGRKQMNRVATYNGVLEQRTPEESGPKWTSIDKRYIGKEHYDSIIACAKEFLGDNWISHWEGGAPDAKFRAALDLAIHTADGAIYQSKIDAPTYNILLNRLASLGNDMMVDTLLPTKVASSDKSYIRNGNEHTSSLLRKDMPMETAELKTLIRVAFNNPEARPSLLPIIAAKMSKKTSTKKKQAEMPEQLKKGLEKAKKKTSSKKSGSKRKASVSVSFADARW